ncbi:hypothetical protein H5410_014240 [Solanum commersonii]|uniref:Uncharacterized protein n=1 Tax=Solanum commersonii TaxID=4109 RepID=A0A9J5ZQF8_SOLCO|nr:hypothetical protein H5410_014240 [Solanum commersonii]
MSLLACWYARGSEEFLGLLRSVMVRGEELVRRLRVFGFVKCDISVIESHDDLKGFNRLSLDGFMGPDDKKKEKEDGKLNEEKEDKGEASDG